MRRRRHGNRYDPPEHTFIYTLSDPNTGEVKYVGKSDSPEDRLKQHMANCHRTYARYGLSPKKRWLLNLRQNGQEPILKVVERCRQERYKERENYWIRRLMGKGADLVNGNSMSSRIEIELPAEVWGLMMTEFQGDEDGAAEFISSLVSEYYAT